MNRSPVYSVVVATVLVLSPTAVWAENIPFGEGMPVGINCELELLWGESEGVTTYYPALDYEVVEYCGHPPTVIWTDEQIGWGAHPLEFWVAAPPVVVAPVVEVPVADPVEVVAEAVSEVVVAEPVVVKAPTALLRPTKRIGHP